MRLDAVQIRDRTVEVTVVSKSGGQVTSRYTGDVHTNMNFCNDGTLLISVSVFPRKDEPATGTRPSNVARH